MTFGPQTNYHTAFVVSDLEATAAALGAPLAVRFTPITTADVGVIVGSEQRDLRLRYVYSIDDGHHIELIESVPGTPYECDPNHAMQFHHLGYWTSDVAGDGKDLAKYGFGRELAITGGSDSTPRLTYHCHPVGLRVELVDAAILETMERNWSNLRDQSRHQGDL
jgi:hypothetical protein